MSTIPYVLAKSLANTTLGSTTPLNHQHCCFDQRFPNENTVLYPDTMQGFLPAGAYAFTENGSVISSCTGTPIPTNSLYTRTDGPIIGATLGSCFPHAAQSHILDRAGIFNVLPSTLARKCFS